MKEKIEIFHQRMSFCTYRSTIQLLAQSIVIIHNNATTIILSMNSSAGALQLKGR